MQGLFIALIYLGFLVLGTVAPFVMGLAYIWVDLFSPQNVNSEILGVIPVSAIIAAFAVGGYLVADRRSPPRPRPIIVLMLLFALWMTLTCTWAEVPAAAWEKWDWAFKTMMFTAFMPFLFRSRVQIEAVVLTIVFSLTGDALAFAPKVLISGGGYAMDLALVGGAAGAGEGSTLSMLLVALIPLLGFMRRHSLLLPWRRVTLPLSFGLSLCCLVATLGTFARTGLVSLAVLGALSWLRSRQKLLMAAAMAAVALAAVPMMGPAWEKRMATIETPTEEGSALGRIAVWEWTLDYVRQHPLGGGFDVYRIDSFSLPMPDGTVFSIKGKAFHSIYFEILGETGFVGFGLWLSMVTAFFASMLQVRRRTRDMPEYAWLRDLAATLMISVAVYLTGGAFIGIGFQSTLYVLFALSVSASEYLRRSLAQIPGNQRPTGQPTVIGVRQEGVIS